MPNYSSRMRPETQTSSQPLLIILSQAERPWDFPLSLSLSCSPCNQEKAILDLPFYTSITTQVWEYVKAALNKMFQKLYFRHFSRRNNMHKQTWWLWGSSLPAHHHLQRALCSRQRKRGLVGALVLTLLLFFISTPIFSHHTLGSLRFLPQEIVYHDRKKNKGILEM